jgi:ATP-binding cassette subfamily C protein/ATP-binding cassette subfamily C protein LapB
MTLETSASSDVDNLANAMRLEDARAFSDASPAAACFVPLLHELGWDGDDREIIETLPHFSNRMDLVDLRGVIALLGYHSEPQKIAFNRIDMRLLPCLFERQSDGRLFVITGYTGTQIIAFTDNAYERLDLASSGFKGTAYFFTREEMTDQEKQERIANWFTRALLRFRKSFKRLILSSLIINVLTISIPLFIMLIYDKVVGTHSLRSLPFLAVGVAIILIGDVRLRALRAEIIAGVAGRLDYLTGVAAFEKILSFPPAMTESATVSTQMARLKEFKSLRDFFTGPLITTAIELPFVVLVLIAIYVLGGPIAYVPLAALGAFLVLGGLWLPQVRRTTLAFGQANAERNMFLAESASHLRTVKDLGAEDIWRDRFRIVSANALDLQDKVTRENAITEALTQGIVMLAAIGVLGFGAASVIGGTMTTGALIATLALLWRALGPFQSGFLAFTRFREIRDSVRLVNQLMKLKSEPTSRSSRLFETAFAGDIVFQRVSFRYNAGSDPALLAVSFQINRGDMVAILGANSSGKSTLLKLIAGMYQPQGGNITIDGHDVRQINPMDLRHNIGYVPQVPEIFYGTIKQNLRLANPLASNEDIAQACDLIGLTPLIERLPEKSETRIGDVGASSLPRGFVQRLSIARALVRGSKILLLDEPEQSLDDEGDRIFIELIKKLKGQVTIILVSHRPSHIKLADSAVVFNEGTIEFSGTPVQAIQASEIIANNLARNAPGTPAASSDSQSGTTP